MVDIYERKMQQCRDDFENESTKVIVDELEPNHDEAASIAADENEQKLRAELNELTESPNTMRYDTPYSCSVANEHSIS